MSTDNKVYVRMKPYSKPKGHLCRRLVYRGALFKAGEWRRVSRAVAEELLKKIQPNSEDSPKPLFDVAASLEEAEAMDASEIPATRALGAKDVTDIREKPAPMRDRSRMIQPAADDAEQAPDDLGAEDIEAEKPSAEPKPRKRK